MKFWKAPFRRAVAPQASLHDASSVSLRWRVMLLAMSMVAMVVVLMAVAVYAVVSRALYDDIDSQLQSRARLLIESGSLAADPGKAIEGTAYSDVNAMLVIPGRTIYTANQEGQTLPHRRSREGRRPGQAVDVAAHREPSARAGRPPVQRQLTADLEEPDAHRQGAQTARHHPAHRRRSRHGGRGDRGWNGRAHRACDRWRRLTEAAERVARTEDLRPIPVHGSDELARLTEAFNMMLRALAESRERQARLVTDAGHELRTPLTSLRTNVELLMASMAPGAPRLPEEEMAGLRTDVIAQIEELSTLVGDLVDLTRDDAGGAIHEPVDMSEVVDRSLERVRRRRNDIEFDVARRAAGRCTATPPGLSRAVLNLLDNAAKWSPPGGRVGVRLTPDRPGRTPSSSCPTTGPGIPPQERRLVFERFYRSTSARAMPGSGLGLAIVKQVVLKHGGTLRVEDTVPGGQPPGTSIHVVLPGRPRRDSVAERGGRGRWPAPRMSELA